LDVMERGLDVVHVCSAVATISGSAGIEGALLGKPVILFGRHNSYEWLSHVSWVTKEEELAPALLRVVTGQINADQARQDGARLAEALTQISFDLGSFTAFDPSTVTDQTVQIAANALLAGLVTAPV
jgi:hypothetical protein